MGSSTIFVEHYRTSSRIYRKGERLHTIYIAAAPELGKAAFLKRMESEIARVKQRFHRACFVGITDGASDYRPWLRQFTTPLILDFWQASEYLSLAAIAISRCAAVREKWLQEM